MTRPRVLMLTHRLPYPPDRGDRIRSYHMLKQLSPHADISLACTTAEPATPQQQNVLASLTKQLAIQNIHPIWSKCKGIYALLKGNAVTPACFDCTPLAKQILHWHQQQPFDVIFTYCTSMIHYASQVLNLPADRCVKHVLDLVDVDSIKWQAYAKQSRPPMKWVYQAEAKRLRQLEQGNNPICDALLVTTDHEAAAYRQHVGPGQQLHVIHNGVDLDYFSPLPPPQNNCKTLLFTGVLDYQPNVQAVSWFAKQVMPRLLKQYPDAVFHVVGRSPGHRVTQLNRLPGINIVGPVDDVRPHLASASVVVAPLLLARGVQNKVLEAMASCKAVVCSPCALQGINAQAGTHLLVAQKPDDWVSCISKLWQDTAFGHRLADQARQRVAMCYNWDTCLRPWLDLLVAQNAIQSQSLAA